jgi:hypothetical protein
MKNKYEVCYWSGFNNLFQVTQTFTNKKQAIKAAYQLFKTKKSWVQVFQKGVGAGLNSIVIWEKTK